jgi:signal transduction histidine kinase
VESAVACRRAFGTLLYDVVHELRTPLTAIAGYAALLAEDTHALDPFARQSIATIERQAARLGDQLETLLALAHLWSGRRPLARARVDLVALARELVRGRGVEVDTPARLRIHGDRAWLVEAAAILLNNALAHGAPPVRVRVGVAGGVPFFAVEDRGPGVAPEFVPLIGRRPLRASPEEAQREGSGLRLLLAAALVETHGGSLAYERDAGITRFTLWFPRR